MDSRRNYNLGLRQDKFVPKIVGSQQNISSLAKHGTTTDPPRQMRYR